MKAKYNIVLSDKRVRGKSITQNDLHEVQKIYNKYISKGVEFVDDMVANCMQSLTNKQIAACYHFLNLKNMKTVTSVKRAEKTTK